MRACIGAMFVFCILVRALPWGGGGGGVLRYISDGDVRSPFLGLKIAI